MIDGDELEGREVSLLIDNPLVIEAIERNPERGAELLDPNPSFSDYLLVLTQMEVSENELKNTIKVYNEE